MAEWSELPKDLLHLISQFLGNSLYLIRFRSVCSAWRSSLPYKPLPSVSRLPIIPCDGIQYSFSDGFALCKRTVLLISLSPEVDLSSSSSSGVWLVKIEEDARDKIHLLNPLSKHEIKPFRGSYPTVLNLLDCRVCEIGQEYVLQYPRDCPLTNFLGEGMDLYMEKVAFYQSNEGSNSGFVILTIHVSGKLTMFKSVEKNWQILDDMSSPYDDVILYEGKFFAIDGTGRLVNVGLDFHLSPVASSIFGGDKKYLVESNDELLLVDTYVSTISEDDLDGEADYEFYSQFGLCIRERILRFKVFVLDKRGGNWVEIKNLGDQMLFLGENITFSVSARNIYGCRGNCIFVMDGYLQEEVFDNNGIYVFDLETDSVGPLSKHPFYSMMFWPPPSWIRSRITELQDGPGRDDEIAPL